VQFNNCQRNLEATEKEATYQLELALLKGQFKDEDESITLLPASYNLPN